VVAGYSDREIAEYFKISVNTVKHYLSNIFEKLGVGWSGGPEGGDAAGITAKKPRSPKLNSGFAAASLE
jgi:transposase